jgi:hypothetical protein
MCRKTIGTISAVLNGAGHSYKHNVASLEFAHHGLVLLSTARLNTALLLLMDSARHRLAAPPVFLKIRILAYAGPGRLTAVNHRWLNL